MLKESEVKLRPLKREDSNLFYEWITDKELMIFNSSYRPVSELEHEQWFDSMMSKRPDIISFVIEAKSPVEAIGSCQLMHIDMLHRNAELQIRIGKRESQSKGFGPRAISLLLNYGFKDLNLHRIYLRVFANNERAIRSYLKCGFTEEGRLKDAAFINGQYVDILIMGILRSNNE